MVASVDPSVMLEIVKVFPATDRVGLKSMSFGWFIHTETSIDKESRMLTRLISTVSTMAINFSEG
jgi:dihydroxyacetone kinase